MYLKKKSCLHVNSLLFALALLAVLVSCQSDDAEPSTVNTITLDDQPFNIQSATLVGVSLDGEGHAALNLINTDGTLSKSLGIDFEYSPDVSISGTYSFPQNSTDRFLDDWLTNYTEMTQSSSASTNLQEGTITVKDNGGSNYTVTIDLLMEDGKVFKGTYQGKIQAMFNNG